MRGVAVLAVVLLAGVDNLETKGCSSQNSTPSSSQVFSTDDGVRFRVEVVAKGLEIPWSLVFMPDGRLLVPERHGRVRVIDTARGTADIALTIDNVFTEGEAGLLGLALDPAFASNRLVYVYYTARSSGGAANRVVRYRESGGRLAEPVVLLDNIPANTIHDGGRLRFGPDGLLYITAGDAANEELAQDVASYAGKILRINADGTTPRGNPFSSPIYSYGHRNPQGLDWHPATGDLWASEHGATGNDEINVVEGGANYGWPLIQGNETLPGMREPITFYNPAIAPSGASFYRGQRFPQFTNNLFVATLRGTLLLRLRIDPSARRLIGQERLLEGQFGRLRDVVTGPDGYVYFCTNNRDGRGDPTSDDDRIARLVPAS
ncbi:MAG TPA: PQQ-dependent sugar dehydrogenase [Vicinamibacterales bacterium]|jgi:glucose/arabinose dehydrogenase|nr:PQQ-dependent sugar dehydrogenase [Vicinamibacterales bacterium]